MDKLQVTKEIKEALDDLCEYYNNETILKCAYKADYENDPWIGKYKSLDGLTTEQFARAIMIGYEVKESPEEEYVRIYEVNSRSMSDSSRAFAAGMDYVRTLFKLNI